MISMKHLWLLAWCCGALVAGAGELQDAAGRGDLEKVRSLVRANPAALNTRTGGTTALHEAVRAGHLEMVKLLVSSGANVNDTDFSGLSPVRLVPGTRPEIATSLRATGGLDKAPVVAKTSPPPTSKPPAAAPHFPANGATTPRVQGAVNTRSRRRKSLHLQPPAHRASGR